MYFSVFTINQKKIMESKVKYKISYLDVAQIFISGYEKNLKEKGSPVYIMEGVPSHHNCDISKLIGLLSIHGFKVQTREWHSYWGVDIKITK